MKYFILIQILMICFGSTSLIQAEESFKDYPEQENVSHTALNIPVEGFGLSIGNSERCTGIRLNFRDHHLRYVNGVNLTFWRAKENPKAVINGFAIGLVHPTANDINGVAAGLIGISSLNSTRGINIAGLTITGEHIIGINIAGLMMIGEERITGLNFAGLFIFDTILSIFPNQLPEKRITGFSIAGASIVAKNVTGITIGGVGVITEEITGIAMGGLGVGAEKLTGIAVGGYCRYQRRQTGLSIGLLNIADHLNGIQIGVINYAKNNPPFLKILPGININL